MNINDIHEGDIVVADFGSEKRYGIVYSVFRDTEDVFVKVNDIVSCFDPEDVHEPPDPNAV